MRPSGSRASASPESTGGSGTVAEHRLGGAVLAALLLGEPLIGLGGVLVPTDVTFQAASAVDDLVVVAEGAGSVVTWYVASRIRPPIGPGAPDTVKLFAEFLAVVGENVRAVEKGEVQLGLATLPTHGPARELAELCKAARGTEDRFRQLIARRNRRLRSRLGLVDALVRVAAGRAGWSDDELASRDWTWLLLSALRVVLVDWEDGSDGASRLTTALSAVTSGDLGRAQALRHLLNGEAADHASAGTTVTAASLRRSLVGRVRLDKPARPGPAVTSGAEELHGRDQGALRVFVSSRMDGSLARERQAVRDSVRRFPHLRPWLWEEHAVPGPANYEQECTRVASTSDQLVLIVGHDLSALTRAEYEAAERGGAGRYVMVRDGHQQHPELTAFLEHQRGIVPTRRFANLAELDTHLSRALNDATVRDVRQQSLARRGVSFGPEPR